MFAAYFRWFVVILFGYMYILSATSAEGGHTRINLEGSASERDARIGSTINITCYQIHPNCGGVWQKDGRRFYESSKQPKRIEWIQAQKALENNERWCTMKVTIRNITVNDTGNYTCISTQVIDRGSRDSGKSIFIYAVPCFQGYYCAPKARTAQLCPKGTFSTDKNATSVEDCKPCAMPYDKNEILSDDLGPKTAALFRRNCRDPVVVDSKGTSSLLPGELIAIWISVAVAFIGVVLIAVFCGLRMSKADEETLFDPKDVVYDLPKELPSKDVFICYSTKNKDWVRNTLLAHLQEQDFQVVIDFLDFEGGLPISDNIINAIYGSRKTVFVLSSDSLKSYHARTELRQALAAGVTGHQVIVIRYEKCKLPAEITHLGSYFDWTDKRNRNEFWKQLYQIIRTSLPHETINTVSTPAVSPPSV